MNPRRTRIATTAVVTVLAFTALIGCGRSPGGDPITETNGAAGASTTTTPTVSVDTWRQQHFAQPVLESDTTSIPFTHVPTNPKGELIPPGTVLAEPVMWQAIGCQALPFSSDAGPTTRTEQGWPAGWSRTAKGAALASVGLAILFEVIPNRAEFEPYLVGDRAEVGGFLKRSEVRDPREGVRTRQWNNAGSCFRSATARRVDLEIGVELVDDKSFAAVRWYAPKYKVAWDFPLIWDREANDWRTTPAGFRTYWRTVDKPTNRPLTKATFSW